MRRWPVALLLIAAGIPSAAQRMTVATLHSLIEDSRKLPDQELAATLSSVHLTQRLSWALLEQWKADLPGFRSQRALIALADRSAFLDPPDGPAAAAPALAEQRRIMGLAATYVAQAIPQLPRFYATRTVTHFESLPATGERADPGDELRAVRITHAQVQYRDGKEAVDPGPVQARKVLSQKEQGLTTWGIFGPILGIVMLDAAKNRLEWSHWEQGEQAPVAVFRYEVPKATSHYQVRYCCVVSGYDIQPEPFEQMSGYHGEMFIDSATGTILRLTLQADLDHDSPMARADLAVEYAPVQLGGVTIICPARSLSISVARSLRTVESSDGRRWPAMGPMQLLLNHAEYGSYHLFRSQSRILSGDEERTAKLAPDLTLTAPADEALPADEELADLPAASKANGPSAAETVNPPAAAGEPPEISATPATALPDAAPHPAPASPSSGAGFTLRVTTRLVDVNVIALDKKGRPIPDLKREDFEVHDDGQKVDLRSFSQAAPQMPAATPATAIAANPVAAPRVFSNLRETPPARAGEDNTIVLLIDPANLVFNDFSDARRQAIEFLRRLPANQRVALYAMHYHGFEVLEEPTADHESLTARLSKWLPSSQDLANSQDQEHRNRQQIEFVHSPEDLLSVNGGVTLDPATQTQALDPNLRELGSMPGPNALDALVAVADHLGAMPGHKSLIWITSDNVLADWTRSSITIEKRSRFIEPIALRTQEAMNNAHVSVYPVDASRLEASVISPEIGRRNVELTPAFVRPPSIEHELEGTEMNAGIDANIYGQNRDLRPGRLTAQMQQDIRPIMGVFREIADATGGHPFRRSNNLEGEFDSVVADGRATYLLGFSPTQPADGKYHLLTVKLVGHRDATLRYRTGYNYDKDPESLKERFLRAVRQPADASDITLSAQPVMDAQGRVLRITVSCPDLALVEDGSLHTGKLDIFLVRKDETGAQARVTGRTIGLRLKPETFARIEKDGLVFDERIDFDPGKGSLRVIVVDVSSGRMGSVTVPAPVLMALK